MSRHRVAESHQGSRTRPRSLLPSITRAMLPRSLQARGLPLPARLAGSRTRRRPCWSSILRTLRQNPFRARSKAGRAEPLIRQRSEGNRERHSIEPRGSRKLKAPRRFMWPPSGLPCRLPPIDSHPSFGSGCSRDSLGLRADCGKKLDVSGQKTGLRAPNNGKMRSSAILRMRFREPVKSAPAQDRGARG